MSKLVSTFSTEDFTYHATWRPDRSPDRYDLSTYIYFCTQIPHKKHIAQKIQQLPFKIWSSVIADNHQIPMVTVVVLFFKGQWHCQVTWCPAPSYNMNENKQAPRQHLKSSCTERVKFWEQLWFQMKAIVSHNMVILPIRQSHLVSIKALYYSVGK